MPCRVARRRSLVPWALAAACLAPGPAALAAARVVARPLAYNAPVVLTDLPPAARRALDTFYRRERAQPLACWGKSQAAFEAEVQPLFRTEYNGDASPDFIFRSPCEAPDLARTAPDRLLLSKPLGYEVAVKFAARLEEINGRAALLVERPCPAEPAPEEAGATCYAGRLLDPRTARWGALQAIRLAADGTGYWVQPLARPQVTVGAVQTASNAAAASAVVAATAPPVKAVAQAPLKPLTKSPTRAKLHAPARLAASPGASPAAGPESTAPAAHP